MPHEKGYLAPVFIPSCLTQSDEALWPLLSGLVLTPKDWLWIRKCLQDYCLSAHNTAEDMLCTGILIMVLLANAPKGLIVWELQIIIPTREGKQSCSTCIKEGCLLPSFGNPCSPWRAMPGKVLYQNFVTWKKPKPSEKHLWDCYTNLLLTNCTLLWPSD